jgi:ferrous iron transport protein B
MASRTIESRNDRILTILINPFMSCSARLPVYILIIGAVFPKNPSSVLFLVYGTGISMAAIIAIMLKKTFFKSHEAPFVMELPPYRLPTLKAILKNMWFKGSQYLRKMGGIILIAVILIWAAGYFPLNTSKLNVFNEKILATEYNLKMQIAKLNPAVDYVEIEQLAIKLQHEVATLEMQRDAFRLENSFIGKLGKFIEPAIVPLGFDWKMGVSLVTGAAAKEIVVSTMGVLYQTDQPDDSHQSLVEKIKDLKYTEGPQAGKLVFNPISAFAFLIFVLIYFPCVAVVAAVKKETGGWKWAAFLAGYTTLLAYFMAFAINQIGNLIF